MQLYITQRQLDIMKIIFMIGLIVTIAVVGFLMWKYGSVLNSDPCSLCDCINFNVMKGGYG